MASGEDQKAEQEPSESKMQGEEMTAESMEKDKPEKKKPQKNIVELASGTDKLSSLVECVKAAQLVDALQAEGPYTVFAPKNQAFEQIPKKTREKLMNEKQDQLAGILKYHVVKGSYTSDQLPGKTLTTLQGQKLKFSKQGSYLMINGKYAVENGDIKATNGTVHIINGVMQPS